MCQKIRRLTGLQSVQVSNAIGVGLPAAFLALLTISIFWPTMQHGFVNYDDNLYVTENARVQEGVSLSNIIWAFANPIAANWHPLTLLSHMFDCQFAGLNPWGHHLTSVLLHSANSALVFVLLRYLTGATWRSMTVAALFAIHPLRVESVAWVAERKDVLSGFFGLLALISYARYAKPTSGPMDRKAPFLSRSYWFALFWFVLGLMSKPMLVTWPFVLFLLDYWPLQRVSGSTLKLLVVEKMPFLILSAASSAVTFVVQRQGGALKTLQSLPFGARAGNALISYCRYLEKTFWPTDLAVLYSHPGYWPATQAVLAGGLLLGISALALLIRHRQTYFLVGWLWFVGTLVPVIGLVQAGHQAMADRYTYLPSVGLLVLAVWQVNEFTKFSGYQGTLLFAAGLAAILVCGLTTRRQLHYWQNSETLFRHAIGVTENNYVACYNLGIALEQNSKSDEAIQAYREALHFKPDYADACVNLGVALERSGRNDEATTILRDAVRLDPRNPAAFSNLGVVLFHQGQTDEAIEFFQEAIQEKPEDASIRNNLGAALFAKGRLDDARQQFQVSLRLRPEYAEARCNLANILARQGQTDDAIHQYQEAMKLMPGVASLRNNLGAAFYTQGRRDEAIQQFQEALRLKPDFVEARFNLAKTLVSQGQTNENTQWLRDVSR